MKWYQVILFPLALIYGLIVELRNMLYKAKVLRTLHVSIPTICVGNLAVGGTGKTPFVEYLIRQLQPHYQVAVLSRGYKRKTRGFVLAGKNDTAITIGDEPMQIHTKFPDIPVAVCADRVHGIRCLKQKFPSLQVVLLDDAFQYRRLRCGYYILLTAYDNLYVDDHFLPMGRLRDARHESLRASTIVVTKCPDTMRPIDQRIVDNKLHLPKYQQLCFSSIVYPQLPANQRILLVTGIAHPEYIVQHMSQVGVKPQLLAYPDHYQFMPSDIEHIAQQAEKVDLVLTTEKDYMRLQTMDLPLSLSAKLQVLPITIDVTDADNLLRRIRQYINENLHIDK